MVLAWKLGTASVLVYILLGAVGVPVFAGFTGGAQALVNYTGGFIWGFLGMALLCGIGVQMKNKIAGILLGTAGLAVCHLFGTIQFMVVMKMGLVESFLLASAPYLIKANTLAVPSFHASTTPANATAKVCNVIGTPEGIGMEI